MLGCVCIELWQASCLEGPNLAHISLAGSIGKRGG
jgi:hypothetical protein